MEKAKRLKAQDELTLVARVKFAIENNLPRE
jgi:hypothetical protein